MYKILIFLLILLPSIASAQDTAGIVVHKDARIDQLIHRQMEINEETTRDSRRSMPGFRIQVISYLPDELRPIQFGLPFRYSDMPLSHQWLICHE